VGVGRVGKVGNCFAATTSNTETVAGIALGVRDTIPINRRHIPIKRKEYSNERINLGKRIISLIIYNKYPNRIHRLGYLILRQLGGGLFCRDES